MLKCIMKIMQLHLFLLIWCQSAETLTDQLTDLGLNVSINCDLDEQEVNWLLLKLPDPPVMILLSSTTSANFYYDKTIKHKYSVQGKHHLLINNVTLDDLGLYYCVSTDTPPKYNNGTRLNITELTLNLENKNHTVVKYIDQNQTQWQIMILISVLLNGVLIIVIIALIKMFALGSKRTRDNSKQSQDAHLQQPQAMDLEEPQNSSQAQDIMADFSTPCKKFQPRQINETYALLELPESTPVNNL
ncbi:uncharacterized protein LOC113065099 isoform X2 [Carassius auratus]|uniref:Uncharacterized protein LOC113065099 isoform X2 n=1 Tax=Carassius auratus TaxID=7957 RepID=A0A6P6M681_CARAU|nr:uncharacterized protein LOC113065099 isoform X2 [Carassius auratus]